MEQSQIQGNNQQESLLWWLGGIIDGEGCITINWKYWKNRPPYYEKKYFLFFPLIIITNTNRKLIEKCQEILQTFNIPFWITYKEKGKGRRKPCWWVIIKGLKRCIKALNLLVPYIIAKQEEAKLVKRFCELRLSRKNGNEILERDEKGRFKTIKANKDYTKEEIEIVLRVAEIHNRNPQRLYAELRKYFVKYFANEDIVQ